MTIDLFRERMARYGTTMTEWDKRDERDKIPNNV